MARSGKISVDLVKMVSGEFKALDPRSGLTKQKQAQNIVRHCERSDDCRYYLQIFQISSSFEI